MNFPKGVEVCLRYLDGIPLEVDDHNFHITGDSHYLGALNIGKATISVQVDPAVANRIFGIAIDHKSGAVHLKRDLANDPLMGLAISNGAKWYETKVNVVDTKDFIPTTKYPQNYMALIELDAEKPGLVRMWEVALVSQKGVFWVTTQCTYEVQCYRDGTKVSCPFFENEKPRPSLLNLFSKLLESKVSTFPQIGEYRPVSLPTTIGIWPDHGRVLWWNCAMGRGVILTTEGAARVHWSNVKNADGLAHFNPSDLVTYEELGPPFQTYERETSLKFEAFGVRKFVRTSERVTVPLPAVSTT